MRHISNNVENRKHYMLRLGAGSLKSPLGGMLLHGSTPNKSI
jgi:hypothetical protein